jgi:hypothetical protein
MSVLAERHSRVEVDAHLDDLASGVSEIVPLEIGALDSRASCSACRRGPAQTKRINNLGGESDIHR